MRVRLAYFVSHPIQYQAPLLRRIAQEPDIDLKVFFSSDLSLHGYHDAGFGGVQVKWDVPLVGGYAHEFLPALRKSGSLGFARPLNYGIASRLRAGQFDALWVHGYHTLSSLHAITLARLRGIPVLLRSDSTLNDHPRGNFKLLVKRLFFTALRGAIGGVLPVGEKNAAYWRASLGETIPSFPMPYAVDNEYFRERTAQAAPHREELRTSLKLAPGLPVFLYASKLQARKRCIDLVEAFLRLAPENSANPLAYLLVAGDGAERASVEQRIAQSGCANIRMLGFLNQSELPRFYDLCDAFILPSIYEPWGLIINEVMSAGRAVIVSDQVGCAPDLVRDGINGFVFPACNVVALSKALRRFLDDPALAHRMGNEAAPILAAHSFEQDVAGLRRALAFAVPGFVA